MRLARFKSGGATLSRMAAALAPGLALELKKLVISYEINKSLTANEVRRRIPSVEWIIAPSSFVVVAHEYGRVEMGK